MNAARRSSISLLTALAVALAGCATATIGSDFNATRLPELQVGVTRFDDAVRVLGRAPDSTVVGETGNLGHTWVYVHSSSRALGIETKSKRVVLVFQPDGKFQRILQLDGVALAQEHQQRLFATPQTK